QSGDGSLVNTTTRIIMINDLKTVSEINAEISRLQRRAETIKRKTRQNVLADIVRTMRDNDLTIDEIVNRTEF
ncbi:hypothetical protein QWA_17193, partial [Alcaligenes faecalis subsp. faecalis NCIB 8687]